MKVWPNLIFVLAQHSFLSEIAEPCQMLLCKAADVLCDHTKASVCRIRILVLLLFVHNDNFLVNGSRISQSICNRCGHWNVIYLVSRWTEIRGLVEENLPSLPSIFKAYIWEQNLVTFCTGASFLFEFRKGPFTLPPKRAEVALVVWKPMLFDGLIHATSAAECCGFQRIKLWGCIEKNRDASAPQCALLKTGLTHYLRRSKPCSRFEWALRRAMLTYPLIPKWLLLSLLHSRCKTVSS